MSSQYGEFQVWRPTEGYDWRGGRVAESTGLLNLHTGNRITSSNLVLSAQCNQQGKCRTSFGAAFLYAGAPDRELALVRRAHIQKAASGRICRLIAPGHPEMCEGAPRLSKSRPPCPTLTPPPFPLPPSARHLAAHTPQVRLVVIFGPPGALNTRFIPAAPPVLFGRVEKCTYLHLEFV